MPVGGGPLIGLTMPGGGPCPKLGGGPIPNPGGGPIPGGLLTIPGCGPLT